MKKVQKGEKNLKGGQERMKKYLAMLDNGHDYTSIEYYSEHRNGSKANLEDCKKEMVKRWGYKAAQSYKITSTELYPCY